VEKVTQADFLKHMSSLRNAKKIDDPRIKYYDVKKVSIVPLDKNVLYAEADGEFLGKAPVEVGILPKKINLIYNPIS
jgi:diacylglycerol kinase family enzyme